MHYREQQLRLILKQHQNKWEKERDILQHDIWTLENSTDLKLLNQAQAHSEKLQKALDSIIAVLGKEEIKELKDIQNLLKGKTLKGLISHYQKQLTDLEESKNEELETLIIKQTELEALRQDQQKELKKEIDTQQKELIERTREIWDLEKKQEQTSQQLKETQEQLTNKDNQLKEQKGTNILYQQKINDLDNQLINLAHQKIKNQKEAQALLNQLENNWKAEKENWKNDKQELLKSWNQERDNQAQSLALERKDFYGQIEKLQQTNQELTTNLTEKGKVITDHLSSIKDLEREITNHKDQVKKLEAKRLTEQEEHNQEKNFWNQEAIKQQELYNQLKKELQAVEKDSQGLFKQLQEQKEQTNLKEQEIQLKNKKVKEMEEWSKVQHNQIKELEKEKTTNQQQIAELKQAGREVRDLLKSTKNQLQEKDKELQTQKEEVKKQLSDQITQIKKATGLDTVMNKFISFDSLLEKVKTKLEKGSKAEETEAQFKEKEEQIKKLETRLENQVDQVKLLEKEIEQAKQKKAPQEKTLLSGLTNFKEWLKGKPELQTYIPEEFWTEAEEDWTWFGLFKSRFDPEIWEKVIKLWMKEIKLGEEEERMRRLRASVFSPRRGGGNDGQWF